MEYRIKHILFILGILAIAPSCQRTSASILSQETVNEAEKKLSPVTQNPTLFAKALAEAIVEVDQEIKAGIEVPIPKDMAGGYTHERHKRNWIILQQAGSLYEITKQEKYAAYIKESLMAYAEMYPTLPLHPTQRSYATGKKIGRAHV